MANLEALRQLKRVVKAAPADRLHMECVEEEKACGTVRCAYGWARADRWFWNASMPASPVNCGEVMSDSVKWWGMTEKTFTRLFAIHEPDALYSALFANPHAVTKKMVLTNIDRLIAGKKPRSYLAMINESKRSKKSAPRASTKSSKARG